jgi:hypothetical protein
LLSHASESGERQAALEVFCGHKGDQELMRRKTKKKDKATPKVKPSVTKSKRKEAYEPDV